MEINITEIPTPSCKSFTVFAKPDFNLLIEEATITVTADFNTKTTITTDMQWWSYCVKINLPHPEYKFHKKEVHSMFTWTTADNYYFKKLKVQWLQAYKNYLRDILPYIFKTKFNMQEKDLPVLNVNLINKVFTHA